MKKKKLKISVILMGLLVVFLIVWNIYFMNYVINKDGLVEIFGGKESFYFNDSTIKDYKCIKLNGSNWQQAVFVDYNKDFNAGFPKNWMEKKAINLSINKDTLVIDFDNSLPIKLKNRPIHIYLTMPEISYVSSTSGACHVHGFNLDTIFVENFNYGTVWLDEDTISYLDVYGQDNSRFGIFDKSMVENANYDFKDESTFMSRGTYYKSVNKEYGPKVKLEISGRGSEFVER